MATVTEGGNPAYLDNIVFKKRNPIVLRSIGLLFSIIVYGCMAIETWTLAYVERKGGMIRTKTCIYGEDSGGICSFGIFVSFVALLASIFFLGGEFVIDKQSFQKYRRQYYFFELIFSGVWTVLFFLVFCVLESQWSTAESEAVTQKDREGAEASVRTAVWFSFFSIPVWAGCTYFVLQRYRVMKAQDEYCVDMAGRRPSAYPATITVPGTTAAAGSTTVTF